MFEFFANSDGARIPRRLRSSLRAAEIDVNSNSQLSISMSKLTDVRSILRNAIAQLERNHVPSAALAAELLLMRTLNHDRTWLYAHPEYELDASQRETYFSLIAQRASRVPTQHLTGHQEFWGLEFEVNRDVLIPRPETEHVIEVALERLKTFPGTKNFASTVPLEIADVGIGSGCIAVALAHEIPEAHIVATDISAAALAVARRNAARHAVDSRIEFLQCDLLQGILQDRIFAGHSFDLIVSNPPYIGRNEAVTLPVEVGKHEPELALFAGETGTELYAPLIQQAAKLLKPGGLLVLELGHNSADHVARLLDTSDWNHIAINNDLAGTKRVASAVRG